MKNARILWEGQGKIKRCKKIKAVDGRKVTSSSKKKKTTMQAAH